MGTTPNISHLGSGGSILPKNPHRAGRGCVKIKNRQAVGFLAGNSESKANIDNKTARDLFVGTRMGKT